MGDSSNGGGGAADSYIGSLISLTSKSEIRYEGILYTVDTANSNIALQDVRSFGTEGRKKDGPQVPPSDKVYDYIIFRGTDIKDLQVKSSPPIRPPQPQGHHDPAIISVQSQTSPLAPPVAPGGMTAASGSQSASSTSSSSDRVNAGPYSSLPAAGYQPSLYPPAGGMGSWAMPQIPPGSNGSMAMPMYWPGYYRPPGGMPHLQQQAPMPFQAPSSLPSNYLTQARLMQQQQPLTAPSSLSSTLPVPASSESAPLPSGSTHPSNTTASTSIELSTPSLTSSISSTLEASSSLDYSSLMKDGSSLEAAAVPKVAQSVLDQTASNPQSGPSSVVQSNKLLPSTTLPFPTAVLQDTNKSLTATQSQPSTVSEDSRTEQSQLAEEIKSSSSVVQPQVAMNQPLLPLPINSVRQKQNNQGYNSGNIHPRRGKGRGRGYGAMGSQTHSKFTEDFDFIAMNEKFNKDEVWGELGKSEAREKGEAEEDACDDYPHEEEDPSHMVSFQPAYVKDDFFDSLSCDTFDRGGHAERPKFSEQRKIDTETFGKFSVRFHGGRGGRGGYRGHRGGYYGGRGNGHSGRGRHNSRHNAAY